MTCHDVITVQKNWSCVSSFILFDIRHWQGKCFNITNTKPTSAENKKIIPCCRCGGRCFTACTCVKETLQLWTVVWGAVIKRYLRCCRSSYSFLYLFKNRRRTIESSSKRNNEPRLSWTPGMLGGSDSTRSNAVGFLQRGPRTSRGLWPGPDVAVNGGGFVALTVPYFSFSVIVSFQLFFTWFIHGGGCSVSRGPRL